MLMSILVALLLVAQAPAAAPPAAPPAPAEAPAAAPVVAAPAPVDPVIAEIDRLMGTWKGKMGDGLRGRLGLSYRTQAASDGEVVFWMNKAESMACGVNAAGDMRCGVAAEAECGLGVAFDKAGKVKTWKAQGYPEACQKFVAVLAKP